MKLPASAIMVWPEANWPSSSITGRAVRLRGRRMMTSSGAGLAGAADATTAPSHSEALALQARRRRSASARSSTSASHSPIRIAGPGTK